MTKTKTDEPLKKFIKILNALREIDPEFPIQYALCLSLISKNEGLSLTQLADEAELTLSTISRIVSALSSDHAKFARYNLLELRVCDTERRKKEIYLSKRGQKFLNKIESLLS